MRALKQLLVASIVGVGVCTQGVAQEWEYTLSPYLWTAGIDGEIEVRGHKIDVDVGFDDILDAIEWGFLAALEARRDRTILLLDAIYIELGQSGNIGLASASVDVDQFILTAAVGRELEGMPLSVFAGGRYIYIENTIKGRGPLGVRASKSENLVDPVLGARVSAPVSEKVLLSLTGDIGGFGVGTDFSWELMPLVDIKINERVSGKVGYRILDLDFSEDIDFDAMMHGWVVGLGILF